MAAAKSNLGSTWGFSCHARHPLAKLLGWTTKAVNSVCKILFPPIAWTPCWSLILPTFAISADSRAVPAPSFSPEGRGCSITDGRYTEQARAEVQTAQIVIARQGPLAGGRRLAVCPRTRRKAVELPSKIGIEGEHMTVAARSRLAGILPSGFRLREAPALVEQARMVKDEEEIACIRSAVLLGASLFDRALEVIRPGVRETEVAAEMEYAARKAGAEAMSFETIIASGERSALPHGRASQAAIPAQGFVVCDFGVILSGYCSDMTRTVYVGRPSAEARGVYQAVKQAQQAAVDAVRPGISVARLIGLPASHCKKVV